jgi:hypothetical protein
MTDRELMQQALDALEYAADATKPEGLHGCECLICKTITALRDRLAKPEQEPVGKFAQFTDGIWREVTVGSPGVLLYAAQLKEKNT